MNFLLHESIILNSFLDELHSIVYEGEISDENRLLTLVDEDAIEQARNCVSFAWPLMMVELDRLHSCVVCQLASEQ